MLRTAADCGAVGHCISTVWENEDEKIRDNDASEKIDYLASRVTSACRDISNADVSRLCKHNTNGLEKYLSHVLLSKTSADTMCRIVASLVGASKCTWGPSYWCSNFSKMNDYCGIRKATQNR
ncbi:unnamed protein product [Leptidea sinapis]|uniref:Saposin A-type domain-containing protein n=1 Tax=Leptidea sinapis TaxID=189913 RepID=A0A5E4QFC7_9NEOP|nr:unnamed protein product [Leptidea sinapis]